MNWIQFKLQRYPTPYSYMQLQLHRVSMVLFFFNDGLFYFITIFSYKCYKGKKHFTVQTYNKKKNIVIRYSCIRDKGMHQYCKLLRTKRKELGLLKNFKRH